MKDTHQKSFRREAVPLLDEVYRLALQLAAGDREETRTILARTYRQALRRWRHDRPRKNDVAPWLAGICHEIATERLGGPETREVGPTARLEDGPVPEPDPEIAEAVGRLERPKVLDAVYDLPFRLRVAVALVDFTGLRYEECAAIQGISKKRFRARLRRARRALKAALVDMI